MNLLLIHGYFLKADKAFRILAIEVASVRGYLKVPAMRTCKTC